MFVCACVCVCVCACVRVCVCVCVCVCVMSQCVSISYLCNLHTKKGKGNLFNIIATHSKAIHNPQRNAS